MSSAPRSEATPASAGGRRTAGALSVEDWALRYLESTDLEHKCRPPAPPAEWASAQVVPPRPGRPRQLVCVGRTPRSLRRAQLANPRRRAQLLHTFWHHELQAAELMCWAILSFPETPVAFRRGLLGVCLDEIRHMGLYERHIERLGCALGDFPVRDWFWQRVAHCTSAVEFVALMGMGFEGGNLDHTRRFETWFREVGDVEGAELQRIVGDEEVAHVRFALRWFRTWTGVAEEDEFERWRGTLVEPLTPSMMQGQELDRERRRGAGMSDAFLDALGAWDEAR